MYKPPEIPPPIIIIPDELAKMEYCVFKLYYHDRYVIMMGKRVVRQIEIIQDDMRKYFCGRRDYKDFYFSLYEYIYNNQGQEFKFELLIHNPSPYQLLKRCQIEFDEAIADTNCLNSNFQPFLSKMIQTPPFYQKRKYEYWINRGQYLNFRKWQINRHVVPYLVARKYVQSAKACQA